MGVMRPCFLLWFLRGEKVVADAKFGYFVNNIGQVVLIDKFGFGFGENGNETRQTSYQAGFNWWSTTQGLWYSNTGSCSTGNEFQNLRQFLGKTPEKAFEVFQELALGDRDTLLNLLKKNKDVYRSMMGETPEPEPKDKSREEILRMEKHIKDMIISERQRRIDALSTIAANSLSQILGMKVSIRDFTDE